MYRNIYIVEYQNKSFAIKTKTTENLRKNILRMLDVAGCPPFYLLSFWSLLKYNIIKYSKSLHSVIHFMVRIFYSQPCFQSNIRDHKWSTTSPDRQGSFFRTFKLIAYITIGICNRSSVIMKKV